MKLFKNKKQSILKSRKGMTLIELIVVLLIIAILAAVGYFGVKPMIEKSRTTRVSSDFRSFETAGKQMLLENPEIMTKTDITGVEAIYNKYLGEELKINTSKSAKKDPWGMPYEVIFGADARLGESEFYITILSSGSDSQITKTSLAEDDLGIVIALINGATVSETFGFMDSPFPRIGFDVSKIKLGSATSITP